VEKPSGERELKGENESSIHGFMRTELRRSRNSMEEEKAFGEIECKFQKNVCLDTRIVEFGIANWNSRFVFSSGVKIFFGTMVSKNHFP
jgi:hypothetical protein